LKLTQTAFIILAGGKSSRFNCQNDGKLKDKLLSKRGSITILEHVVTQMRLIKIPIYIITRDIERKNIYSDILKNSNYNQEVFIIKESLDKPMGPLGGITTAIQELKEIKTKIFLPADLPYISSLFLDKFRTFIEKSSAELIGLIHPNGQIEHLIFATKGNKIDSIIKTLNLHKITRVSSIMRLLANKQFVQLPKGNFKQVLNDLDHFKEEQPEYALTYNSEELKQFKLEKNNLDPCYLYEKYLKTQDYSLLLKEANFYFTNRLNSLALHALLNYNQFLKEKAVEQQIEEIKSMLKSKT